MKELRSHTQINVTGKVLESTTCLGIEKCPVMQLLGRVDLSKPDIEETLEMVVKSGLVVPDGIQEDYTLTLNTRTFTASCIQQDPESIVPTNPIDKLLASALNPPEKICGTLHYTIFDIKEYK